MSRPLPESVEAALRRLEEAGSVALADARTAILAALDAAFNAGVEAVAVASATCPLPKPYYRDELAAKIRACKRPSGGAGGEVPDVAR